MKEEEGEMGDLRELPELREPVECEAVTTLAGLAPVFGEDLSFLEKRPIVSRVGVLY